MTNPKISIITVSFNAEDFIERTIKSVLEQTYNNIEFIVIDGASKDGTVDIIKQYEDKIDYWLSEPDKNHFDAMNKGLRKATGDYIHILNSGDQMRDKNSLSDIMSGSNGADFIYSRAEYIDEDGKRWPWHKKTPLPNKLKKKSFLNGMVVCHHAMIIKRELAPEFVLDRWRVSNDIDWAIRIMDKVKTVHFWDDTFILYLAGGISTKQRWKAVKERYSISLTHFGVIPTVFEQFKIIFQILKKKIA